MSPARGPAPAGASRRGASTPPPALAPLTPEDAAAHLAALAERMSALADEGRALEAELDKATSPVAGDRAAARGAPAGGRAAARGALAIAPCEVGRAAIATLDARLGTCTTWLNAFDEQLGDLDASLQSLDAACATALGRKPRSEPPTASLARAASRLESAAAAPPPATAAVAAPPPRPEWLSAAAGFVAGLAAVGALLLLTGRREPPAPGGAQHQSAVGYRDVVLWCARTAARRGDVAYRFKFDG